MFLNIMYKLKNKQHKHYGNIQKIDEKTFSLFFDIL